MFLVVLHLCACYVIMTLLFYAVACNMHVRVRQSDVVNEPLLSIAPLREREHLLSSASLALVALAQLSSAPCCELYQG